MVAKPLIEPPAAMALNFPSGAPEIWLDALSPQTMSVWA
jgi:hypothetical protein